MKFVVSLLTLLYAAQISFSFKYQMYNNGWLNRNNIQYEVGSIISWYTLNMGSLMPSDIAKNKFAYPKQYSSNSLKYKFTNNYKKFAFNCTAVLTYYINWTNPQNPYQQVVSVILIYYFDLLLILLLKIVYYIINIIN
jgi:hypothetical protein